MAPQKVMLVPSNDLGWAELHAVLGSRRGVTIVGVATSIEEAKAIVAGSPPDVIFSALSINETSLLPLLADLRQGSPSSTIAVCASSFTIHELQILGELRVSGYLVWTDLCREKLRHALAAILSGVVVGSETVVAMVSAALGGRRARSDLAVSLTPREHAILAGLAAGRTREEIALAEQISVSTVKRTLADVQAKLDAPSLFVLGLKATRLGLVS